MPIRRNPSLDEVFAGHDEDEDGEAELLESKKTRFNEGTEDSMWAPKNRGDDEMEVDADMKRRRQIAKKGKAVGKPRRKAAKPMVCMGAAPFDFTEAMRDARLELTVGQLMNMEKLPRAAIAKAFRSPRRPKQPKATGLAGWEEDDVSATAMITKAKIGDIEVPLILDSGSSLNLISFALLQQLGLKMDRKATKPITGVHGKKHMPLGIHDGLPVAVKGVTIPANVHVLDTNAYALIVGNEWFTRAKAKLDWETMTVTLKWAGAKVTAPVQCWTEVAPPKEDSDSDSDSETDGSSDSSEDDEANEVSDLCTLSLTDQAVTFLKQSHPRLYKDYLWLNNLQNRQLDTIPKYGSQGPDVECGCGRYLETVEDVCYECQTNDLAQSMIDVLPLDELDEKQPLAVQHKKLTSTQQAQLNALLNQHQDLFCCEGDPLPQTHVVQHHIATGDAMPIKRSFRRTSRPEREYIEGEVRKMLHEVII